MGYSRSCKSTKEEEDPQLNFMVQAGNVDIHFMALQPRSAIGDWGAAIQGFAHPSCFSAKEVLINPDSAFSLGLVTNGAKTKYDINDPQNAPCFKVN